jgi:hypothetical protein
MQGAPQAAVALALVRNCRIESAPAESTAMNIAAVTTFFIIVVLFPC